MAGVDYRQAGVDIDAGNETVRRIKALARGTYTPGVLSGVGSFGGLFALDNGASNRVLVASADGKQQPISTDLNGEARRVHAEGELANDFRISPDGQTVAFRQNYEVFAMPLMPGGQAVGVDEKGGALPITKV